MTETDPSLFWWSWWVQVAIAVVTISAVVVALFGQALRARFFPPRLALALVHPEGELTRFGNGHQVRYYHVRVRTPAAGRRPKACKLFFCSSKSRPLMVPSVSLGAATFLSHGGTSGCSPSRAPSVRMRTSTSVASARVESSSCTPYSFRLTFRPLGIHP